MVFQKYCNKYNKISRKIKKRERNINYLNSILEGLTINYTFIGTGKSGYGNINSEIDKEFNFLAGSVALARTNKRNTEDSQFFILLQDAPIYEGEYTPVGKVLYGLEVLKKIKYDEKVEYVLRPDFINSFKMYK